MDFQVFQWYLQNLRWWDMVGLIFLQEILVFLWIHEQKNTEIIKPKKLQFNFTHDYTFGAGFIRWKTLDLIFPEK